MSSTATTVPRPPVRPTFATFPHAAAAFTDAGPKKFHCVSFQPPGCPEGPGSFGHGAGGAACVMRAIGLRGDRLDAWLRADARHRLVEGLARLRALDRRRTALALDDELARTEHAVGGRGVRERGGERRDEQQGGKESGGASRPHRQVVGVPETELRGRKL